jgi:L-tartrate/succinate antiporter
MVLMLINFFAHHMFASITPQVTTILPLLLTVGSTIPDMNMQHLALLLWLQLGIMGIVTPDGTGPGPVYPPSQKATGVNPWMNARWVPAVALAKVGALRRVPPHEVSGEVPRP